jgi:predicted aspartyl protease
MALIEVISMRGRYFWLLAILTALAVAGLPAAHGYGDTESNPPAKSKIKFVLHHDYLIVIQGSVGPLKGLNFLFDTGATPTVLDPRIAEKLHLTTAPIDVAVLKGTVQSRSAIAPTLQFGSVRSENRRVVIQDLSFLQKWLPYRIDGIVGLDVLGQGTIVIDYPSREIRLGSPSPMPDSIPFHREGGLAIVDATIDQAQVRLLVDTGAPSMVLFRELTAPASGSKPSSRTIGELAHQQTRSISLRLGEAEFGHEAAFVVQSPKDAGHDFDGVISPAALGITRVVVDLDLGKIAFTRGR